MSFHCSSLCPSSNTELPLHGLVTKGVSFWQSLQGDQFQPCPVWGPGAGVRVWVWPPVWARLHARRAGKRWKSVPCQSQGCFCSFVSQFLTHLSPEEWFVCRKYTNWFFQLNFQVQTSFLKRKLKCSISLAFLTSKNLQVPLTSLHSAHERVDEGFFRVPMFFSGGNI